MNTPTNPTIVNPNYVIELRNVGRLCTELATSFEKLGGISIGKNLGGTSITTRRTHSAATIRKMKIAAKHRAKLRLHQGGAKAA